MFSQRQYKPNIWNNTLYIVDRVKFKWKNEWMDELIKTKPHSHAYKIRTAIGLLHTLLQTF